MCHPGPPALLRCNGMWGWGAGQSDPSNGEQLHGAGLLPLVPWLPHSPGASFTVWGHHGVHPSGTLCELGRLTELKRPGMQGRTQEGARRDFSGPTVQGPVTGCRTLPCTCLPISTCMHCLVMVMCAGGSCTPPAPTPTVTSHTHRLSLERGLYSLQQTSPVHAVAFIQGPPAERGMSCSQRVGRQPR